MTIPATFESVSERGSSRHVAGLVVQWNVDGCVVADVPVEWLGLAEARNAPGGRSPARPLPRRRVLRRRPFRRTSGR